MFPSRKTFFWTSNMRPDAMVSKLIVPLLAVLSLARIAAAAEYPCPSDPGFCYRDVGDDGCFDSGLDEGPINNLLEAGNYAPADGSIVCSPGVKLELQPFSFRWETTSGSGIFLYEVKLKGESAQLTHLWIDSAEDVVLTGTATTFRSFRVEAGADADVRAKLKAGSVDVFSQDRTELYASTSITAGSVGIHGDGSVVVEEKVRVRATNSGEHGAARLLVTSFGDIAMTSPRLWTKRSTNGTEAQLRLSGDNITLAGTAKLTGENVQVEAGGAFTVDQVKLIAPAGVDAPQVSIEAATVEIGREQNGKLKRSRIRAKSPSEPSTIDIVASGAVVLRDLDLQFAHSVVAGAEVSLLDSRVLGSKFGAATVHIASDPGMVCDLSGTLIAGATLTTDCGSVVGP